MSITPNTENKSAKEATTNPRAPQRPGDQWIWGIFLLLCCISLVESYSASSQEVTNYGLYRPLIKHAIFLVAGILIAYGLQHVHYNRFKVWIPILTVITLVLAVYVMLHGEVINGARRSFTIPGVNLTLYPSEMAKLFLVAMIAWVMSKVQMPGGGTRWSGVIVCALSVLIFGGLFFQQGFTNTAILMAISMAMMLIGGIQLRRFVIVLAFYGLIFVGYRAYDKYVEEHQAVFSEFVETTTDEAAGDRINAENKRPESIDRSDTRNLRMARFDFSEDSCLHHPMTSLYHQEQYGYMARANGGVFGVMPGNSRERSRLPLAFSDYMFSIIIEELGLVGGIFLLILYLALLGRAGSIAKRCKRAFPALLIMGMAVMITVQALSHMAINCGLVPVTGQPLPFISKGGSSILLMSMAIGVMLSVSRYAEYSSNKQQQSRQVLVESGDEKEALNPAQAG